MTETVPQTPNEVEALLHRACERLEQLRVELVAAREAELEAKKAYERAKVTATLDPWCPRVERGGTTVAERQAWIDERVLDDLLALEGAKSLRVIANEALHSAHKELEALQSIGASIRATSYRNTPY